VKYSRKGKTYKMAAQCFEVLYLFEFNCIRLGRIFKLTGTNRGFSLNGSGFSDITPRSPLKVNGRFGEIYMAYIFRVEEQVERETNLKAGDRGTTRRYIPHDGTLHNYRCGILRLYRFLSLFMYLYTEENFINLLLKFLSF
jgi:hypothetical protein